MKIAPRLMAASLMLLLVQAPAWACKCGKGRADASLDASADAIFRAKVVKMEDGIGPHPVWGTQELGPVLLLHVRVTRRIKGNVADLATIATKRSIAACGIGGERLIGREIRFRTREKAGTLVTNRCMYAGR